MNIDEEWKVETLGGKRPVSIFYCICHPRETELITGIGFYLIALKDKFKRMMFK